MSIRSTAHELLAACSHRLNLQRNNRVQSGSDFNLFTTLVRLNDEVRHSRMLAGLLDPAGGHHQGSLFLDLFLQELGIELPSPQQIDRCKVTTERQMRDGRRIDILVESPELVVGIENKIDADEGEGQLISYAKALKEWAQPAYLVFLTPEGRQPCEGIEGITRHVRLVCCAYAPQGKCSIRNWLEDVLTAVREVPRLFWTLRQYEEVLDQMLGKDLNQQETDEIAELIDSPEKLRAASAISAGFDECRAQCQKRFWDRLCNELDQQKLVFVGREQSPRIEVIREYYRSGGFTTGVGITLDAGICWQGVPLAITLELLATPERPYLTHKVHGWAHQARKSWVMKSKIPSEVTISDAICSLRSSFGASPWSLATGDMLVPVIGTEIDFLKLEAAGQSLFNDEFLSEVCGSIVGDIVDLYHQVHEIVQRIA